MPASLLPFSGEHAFSDLEHQVNFGPRVPGTSAHLTCRDWLLQELASICGESARQDFTYPLNGKPQQLTNIIARIGPSAERNVLLCAHWDTRPTADQETDPAKRATPIPGANDGASGVAVLLELARVFSEVPSAVGIQIVLFDGEDYGPGPRQMFLGSRFYARSPILPRPDYAILLDMVGKKDLAIKREFFSQRMAPQINDRVWEAARAMGHDQFADGIGPAIEDDHLYLQRAGIPAIVLIDFDYPQWHTLEDTPDKCCPESLAAVGSTLAFLLIQTG